MANSQDPTQLVKAPALATDSGPKPLLYDPKIGEEAYSARHAAIRAMDPSQVATPTCDPTTAALVSLQFVRAARSAERAPQFASLAPHLGPHSLDVMEQQAWCLWYLDARVQSVNATTTGAKVDLALAEAATQARTRVMRLLDYHFKESAPMQAELQSINQGNGYMDLATDLSRLAGHLSVHKAKLSVDVVNYRADDEAHLRGLANELLAALNADRGNETLDLRNRSWTEHAITYSNLKAAADFLFRNSPVDLALFPALRTAVIAITSRNRTTAAAPEPVVSPVVQPGSPGSPTPAAPGAPSSPVAPGLPGGDPLGGK